MLAEAASVRPLSRARVPRPLFTTRLGLSTSVHARRGAAADWPRLPDRSSSGGKPDVLAWGDAERTRARGARLISLWSLRSSLLEI